MNNNERELEKAGYDEWKLSDGSKKFTFVKKETLGVCPCCAITVYDDELYVEEDAEVFHYSCYNKLKSEE